MRLFISYAREDRPSVEQLTAYLNSPKFEIWFDPKLSAGQNWKREIEVQISRCHVFVFLASDRACESPWCNWEIERAFAAEKPIIPIALRPEIQLPPAIAHLQYADLSGGFTPDFVNDLVTSLKRFAPAEEQEQPILGEYFIGHPLTDDDYTHYLRSKISDVFRPAGYEPYYAESDASGGMTLLRKCQKIFASSFCVFDVSQSDPDVYIELGIALGFNKPLLILTRDEAAIPPALRATDTGSIVRYASFADLKDRLADHYDAGFPPKPSGETNYCYFCDRACEKMSTPPDNSVYLVLNNDNQGWQDVIEQINPCMVERSLYPAKLNDPPLRPDLCDLRRHTLRAKFAVCHLGEMADANTYLALGMIIGSKLPWVVLHQRGSGEIPQNLQGLDRIEYHKLFNFEAEQRQTLERFLNKVMPIPGRPTRLLDRLKPFWQELKDWIGEETQPQPAAEEVFQGRPRIIEKDSERYSTKHNIPSKGTMVFGRDNRCDVILAHPFVSGQHFQIEEAPNGKYYIEDLGSQNGTYRNGRQIKAHTKEEIFFQDTISVVGWLFQFQVWDQRAVPGEDAPLRPGGTARLDLIPIQLNDIIPPRSITVLEKGIFTILHSAASVNVEVPLYYPMGRILAELVKLLIDRKIIPDTEKDKKYRFSLRRRLLDNESTPYDLGLREGARLEIISDPVERTHSETYKRITGCDDRSCGSMGVMPTGVEFGTLRELFNDTYKWLYPEEPLPDMIKLPVTYCPICQQVVKETSRVRTEKK